MNQGSYKSHSAASLSRKVVTSTELVGWFELKQIKVFTFLAPFWNMVSLNFRHLVWFKDSWNSGQRLVCWANFILGKHLQILFVFKNVFEVHWVKYGVVRIWSCLPVSMTQMNRKVSLKLRVIHVSSVC